MKKLAPVAALPLVFGLLAVPAYADTSDISEIDDLTLLATTDIHGTLVDHDYFTGESFGASKPENARGMDHLSTAIQQVRKDKGAESVLLLDNGDAAQGSSIETVYHSNRTEDSVDPMAKVFNHLQYDAVVAGNHEFNYGLAALDQHIGTLKMPFLAANVTVRETGNPAYEQYTMVKKTTADGHDVNVGVIGVVTPGVPRWDGPKVASLEFHDQVETLQKVVPQVKEDGADVIVVLAHTGLDPKDYVWNPADLQENAARSIAQNVSGIDVIVAGHSHNTKAIEQYFTNPDGDEVLVTQPGYHARFLSNVNIPLVLEGKQVTVQWDDNAKPTATQLNAPDYVQDHKIEEVIAPWHEKTVQWVSTVVAQSTEEMKSATSAWEDTAILDFINRVQIDEVTRAFEGSEFEGLPLVAEVSPFSRTAVFKEGDVTIADMASIYVYDNTLKAVKLTGQQLKDYLEWSARYYIQQEPGAQIDDWSTVTNATYPGVDYGLPDYTYDVLSGVNYHIDMSKSPMKYENGEYVGGERIDFLEYSDGTAIQPEDEIILILNDYRQSGGSGYPHVSTAEVVYDEQKAIRDLMIEWAQAEGKIDPTVFFEQNWSVSTSPYEAPEPQPSEPNTDDQDSDDQDSDDDQSATDPTQGETESTTGGSTDKPTQEPSGKPQANNGSLAKTGTGDLVGLGAVALVLLLAGGILARKRMNA
ncbi:MAG: 5'-nucleotidase C-terminal domain-containing protein [Actinomycetaceae bacterium]|nr:5'-nucleotidase C-terminal domain-containing protein [Actinomycetaceae bacterium]